MTQTPDTFDRMLPYTLLATPFVCVALGWGFHEYREVTRLAVTVTVWAAAAAFLTVWAARLWAARRARRNATAAAALTAAYAGMIDTLGDHEDDYPENAIGDYWRAHDEANRAAAIDAYLAGVEVDGVADYQYVDALWERAAERARNGY